MINYIDKIRLSYFKSKLTEIFAVLTHTHSVSDITDMPSIPTKASDIGAEASGTASSAVSSHNTSTSAHSDIRNLITALTTKVNNFLDVDDTTKDQLSEVIELIENNQDLIEGITTSKVNVADIVNNLTTNDSSKPLAASQGVVIKGLIDALQTELDSHSEDTTVHITSTERTNWDDANSKKHSHSNKSVLDGITSTLITAWNAAKTHADSAHAPSDATVVSDSTTNGNILIDGKEVNVYTHPSGTNPHGTTKSDVGLGNVPNVTTNNQTPTYTQASTLANLVSGETLATSMGKIMKAITDLISHIANTSNPHSVTKSQVGLGNVENKSSATILSELTKDNVVDALGYTPPESNTDTVYTHPTTSGYKHIPSGGSSGQILRWSADGTAVWGSDNNTTYSEATSSAAGLMSASDKDKLDNIASGANAYTHPSSGVTAGSYGDSAAQTPAYGGTFKVPYITVDANGHVTGISAHTVKIPASDNSDTKNTAGSTDSSSKLFLIGATSQAANPQTYSHDTAYVGTDGHLYSDSKQVVNLSGSQALTNKTYNGYKLAAACAKGVATSVTSGGTNLPTAGAVYTALENLLGADITESDISSIIS